METILIAKCSPKKFGETVQEFCSRAGVCRATYYNFLSGKKVGGHATEKIMKACGYEKKFIPIVPPATPPAAEPPAEAADATAPGTRRRGRPRRHHDGMPATEAGEDSGRSGGPGCDAGAA